MKAVLKAACLIALNVLTIAASRAQQPELAAAAVTELLHSPPFRIAL